MSDPSELIAVAVAQTASREAAAIERALEQALQHGAYGVLVLEGPEALVAHEHPHVPYGQLYRAPTQAVTDEQFVEAFISWRPR